MISNWHPNYLSQKNNNIIFITVIGVIPVIP